MFEPKPVGSASQPKPLKIFFRRTAFLTRGIHRAMPAFETRAAGIDNETGKRFASNSDFNIEEIKKRLHNGTYGFSRLRPFFALKHGSTKERVICIPTVRDRIVQRAIVNYFAVSKSLPVYNASSFGFIKGQGTAKAIERAVELRSVFEWCVKADVEAFLRPNTETISQRTCRCGLTKPQLGPPSLQRD